ncbi:MAG: MFS transporter [Deltaproteobacteria bacterium]|nr:MFS transporter [Deltaproteobacteria bacterium]MBW2220325.1 MFS transporter [Deltaproteobacteria bacterium]
MQASDKKIFSVLFFSMFSTITGVGIVVPLLPVWAHDLGASGFYIGLIFGAFSLSRTFFLPFFGRISDKKGRKPFIVSGLLAYALISIAFIYAVDITSLVAIRFVQGIASAMIMPVTQAYVGEITPRGREGLSMGLFNLSTFFGLSLGPLAGGLINDLFSLTAAFLCMGVLAMIGCLLSFFWLPPVSQEHNRCNDGNHYAKWSQLLKDKDITGIFIFRLTYTICIGIIWCFLPVFADTEFSLSSSSIGVLVMLGVLISGLMNAPMGYLADRFDKKLLSVSGGLIIAFSICSFVWADGFYDLFLACVLFGIGGGTAMPSLTALAVIKGRDTGSMGAVMALLTMAHSLGMLLGSLLAGFAMDWFDLRNAFPLGSILMIFGVICFIVCLGKDKENNKPAGYST